MPFFGGLHLRALAPCKTNSALALAAAWFLDGICVRFLNRTQVSGWKAGRFGTDELRPLGKRFLNGLRTDSIPEEQHQRSPSRAQLLRVAA